MSKLINMKTGKKSGELKIIDEVGYEWEKIGLLLGIPQPKLRAIQMQQTKIEQRFFDVLECWIKGEGNKYPATWNGLCTVLADSGHHTLAKKIKT